MNREIIEELIEVEPHIKLFIGIDMILYVVYFIWFNIMYKTVDSKSLVIHQIFAVIQSLAAFVNAQYMYVLTFSVKVEEWENEYKNKINNAGTDPTGINMSD